jgi:hypothetical protein
MWLMADRNDRDSSGMFAIETKVTPQQVKLVVCRTTQLKYKHLEFHLTPHTSHLTPHTSHLTPYTSHLTPHTSHVTPHTSHLTPHTSHLTPHTSHLTHFSRLPRRTAQTDMTAVTPPSLVSWAPSCLLSTSQVSLLRHRTFRALLHPRSACTSRSTAHFLPGRSCRPIPYTRRHWHSRRLPALPHSRHVVTCCQHAHRGRAHVSRGQVPVDLAPDIRRHEHEGGCQGAYGGNFRGDSCWQHGC